jgi:hypothetical protein
MAVEALYRALDQLTFAELHTRHDAFYLTDLFGDELHEVHNLIRDTEWTITPILNTTKTGAYVIHRKHGGARPGAGRKPVGAQPKMKMSIAISAENGEWIRSLSSTGKTRGQILDDLLNWIRFQQAYNPAFSTKKHRQKADAASQSEAQQPQPE